MNITTLVLVITSILNVVGALVLWATKAWWTNEFVEAKKAQLDAKDDAIKTKDAYIEALKNEIVSLKELNPVKIREYFVAMKMQLEEYNEKLIADLEAANLKIAELSSAREPNIDINFKIIKEQLQEKVLSIQKQLKEQDEVTQKLINVTSTMNEFQLSQTPMYFKVPEWKIISAPEIVSPMDIFRKAAGQLTPDEDKQG